MTSTPVPWPLAGRVAGAIAGTYPLDRSYHRQHLQAELPAIVARAAEMVSLETRLSLPGDPDVVTVGRAEWAERNVDAFKAMLAPAEQKIAARLDGTGSAGWAGLAARTAVAAETGAVLGVLSRRVLGQYELVVPGGGPADSVAFVAPNILSMERRHQFRPAEFRMWIALHEAAHRAQFVGVSWMRAHFMGLVDDLVAGSEPDAGRLEAVVREVWERRRQGRSLIDEKGVLGLFATSRQREALDRVQALMCLLEGHGHVVMDRLGSTILKSQARMSHLLQLRRSDPRTAAFFRLTGLEMKIRQYQQGAQFVAEVERSSSWETLDLAWSEPEALPTLDEIEHPRRWVRRVA